MPDSRHLSRSRTIVVFDSHPDTIELLRVLFEADGFRVVTVDLRDLRAGRIDVAELRTRYRFDVAVFDIALPYQSNWELFLQLQGGDLAGVPVVLTTTNERALDALLGDGHPEAIEIWGKPYDTERLRSRVHAVLELPDRRSEGADRRHTGRSASRPERRGFERRRVVSSGGRRISEAADSSIHG